MKSPSLAIIFKPRKGRRRQVTGITASRSNRREKQRVFSWQDYPRYSIVNQAQHIILLGKAQQQLYFEEQDYQYFRDCLDAASYNYRLKLHALCADAGSRPYPGHSR